MKLYLIFFFCIVSTLTFAQEKTTIKVIVPNINDDVYIVGNQKDLGDWDPEKIKMFKVSDYVRMISVAFYFPAEFMFTKGTWASEGIIYDVDYNPNIYLEEYVDERVYKIKGWKDELLKGKIVTEYKNDPFESKILSDERKLKVFTPENYSIEKRYPVIYVLDEGHNFKTAAGFLKLWSDLTYKNIPDCILVGIPLKNYEFLNLDKANAQTDLLKDYLTYDVIPFVKSNYSTSGFNVFIGKNAEADFSHNLVLEDNTPFSAIVSLEPRNTIDYSFRLKGLFENYEYNGLYYFIANAKYDKSSDGFNLNMIEQIEEDNVKIQIKDYPTFSENLFVHSFQEALSHIFQDYRNMDDYSDFKQFALNYERNIMDIYSMEANIQKNEIDFFLKDILDRQDVEMYNYLLNFMEYGKVTTSDGKPYIFDEIQKAIHLHHLGLYEESIMIWEETLNNFNPNNLDKVHAKYFYDHIEIALLSYINAGKPKKIFNFLDDCIEKLPAFILESYYFKAKYSAKYNILTMNGRSALDYCFEYYHDNEYFTLKDLSKIKF
jgi:hypothetical protein